MVDLFYFVITTIQPFNYFFKPCTGTRIRTQIKGFGDPYATVAPYPCIKPLALSFQRQQTYKKVLTFNRQS